MTTAEDWVQNNIYAELIGMPIWLHTAFTRDGKFEIDQNGIRLIYYLVTVARAKCPTWNNDKISDPIDIDAYMNLVEKAWTDTRKQYRLIGYVF